MTKNYSYLYLLENRPSPVSHIATNIKALRKKSGNSQAKMGTLAGIDLKNYQRLEYGKHHFSLHTLFRLSRAFGCAIEDLINEPQAGKVRAKEKLKTKSLGK